jgi:hypothetical protein
MLVVSRSFELSALGIAPSLDVQQIGRKAW